MDKNTKEEILKNSAKKNVETLDKTNLYNMEEFLANMDKNSPEYNVYLQWFRIIQEYAIVQRKESNLSKRERDEVIFIVEGLMENGVVELNEDYSIKRIEFKKLINGK